MPVDLDSRGCSGLGCELRRSLWNKVREVVRLVGGQLLVGDDGTALPLGDGHVAERRRRREDRRRGGEESESNGLEHGDRGCVDLAAGLDEPEEDGVVGRIATSHVLFYTPAMLKALRQVPRTKHRMPLELSRKRHMDQRD